MDTLIYSVASLASRASTWQTGRPRGLAIMQYYAWRGEACGVRRAVSRPAGRKGPESKPRPRPRASPRRRQAQAGGVKLHVNPRWLPTGSARDGRGRQHATQPRRAPQLLPTPQALGLRGARGCRHALSAALRGPAAYLAWLAAAPSRGPRTGGACRLRVEQRYSLALEIGSDRIRVLPGASVIRVASDELTGEERLGA